MAARLWVVVAAAVLACSAWGKVCTPPAEGSKPVSSEKARELLANKKVMVVGDSISRQDTEYLVCLLAGEPISENAAPDQACSFSETLRQSLSNFEITVGTTLLRYIWVNSSNDTLSLLNSTNHMLSKPPFSTVTDVDKKLAETDFLFVSPVMCIDKPAPNWASLSSALSLLHAKLGPDRVIVLGPTAQDVEKNKHHLWWRCPLQVVMEGAWVCTDPLNFDGKLVQRESNKTISVADMIGFRVVDRWSRSVATNSSNAPRFATNDRGCHLSGAGRIATSNLLLHALVSC